MAEYSKAKKDKAFQAVQRIVDQYVHIAKIIDRPLFDRRVMDDCKLIDATPDGRIVFELTITDEYANLNGVMHGGAAGLIFDMCTTMALGPVARPGHWEFLGGVTRTLNISYLKALPVGTTIHVKAQVMQSGRTMAMIRGTIESTDGTQIYATVEHHKVHIPMKAELAVPKMKDKSKL